MMDSRQAATLLPHAFRVTPAVSRLNADALGDRSLREIVDSAIARAESQAIRRALALARGTRAAPRGCFVPTTRRCTER